MILIFQSNPLIFVVRKVSFLVKLVDLENCCFRIFLTNEIKIHFHLEEFYYDRKLF